MVRRWFARPAFYGVVLRLLLMPIGACWDLFGYYWLSHQWVYHGAIPPDQYGGLLRMWPPFYLHAAWLWLIRPLLGAGDCWGENLVPSVALTTPWMRPEMLEAFYQHPHIHLVLFLLKCPLVLTEVWLIRFAMRHLEHRPLMRRRLAWWLWLNPISLYTIALCGGWDVVPVALVTAGAVTASRHPIWAAVSVALAMTMKMFPWLLLPFFVLIGPGMRTSRLQLGAATVLGFALWMLVGQWAGVSMTSTVLGLPHYDMLLAAEQPLRFGHDRLYLFIVGYVLLCCHAFEFAVPSLDALIRYSASSYLLFYSVSFFHPQYLTWCVPFLAVVLVRRRESVVLFAIQMVCLAVYTLQFGPILTTYLFAPLNPDWFMSQPSPIEWLAHWIAPERLIGIAHSIFAGVSLWMVYLLVGRGPQRQMADARQA